LAFSVLIVQFLTFSHLHVVWCLELLVFLKSLSQFKLVFWHVSPVWLRGHVEVRL
jgi:hypothetical protein